MTVKRIVTMTPEQVAAAIEAQKVRKVFTAKWGGHTWYVQQMPGMWQLGRDYAVMKDRRRIYYGRFKTEREAVAWCLAALCRELKQQKIDQF